MLANRAAPTHRWRATFDGKIGHDAKYAFFVHGYTKAPDVTRLTSAQANTGQLQLFGELAFGPKTRPAPSACSRPICEAYHMEARTGHHEYPVVPCRQGRWAQHLGRSA